MDPRSSEEARGRRNLAAVSLTSFLTDLSSEMVINLLPLYLSGVLGLKANVIGLIEGVAEATSSLLKVVAGWLSDRLGARKWLAVTGYGISALSKPLFYLATTWPAVAGVRWLDRVGKGVRTAPRDALLADSVRSNRRGRAFGLHRAADTAGAVLGLGGALAVVWWMQGNDGTLSAETWRTIVLLSVIPAVLAVLVLAIAARDVTTKASAPQTVGARFALRGLGQHFGVYLGISALFDLGNSSEAFLVLLASERGLSVVGVLGMLISMNVVYTLSSAPAGAWSDRIGRRRMLIAGWALYAAVYLGLAAARTASHVWILVAVYGLYHGMTHGAARAMVADLVPADLRGTAYGTYSAVLGLLNIPASVIAGVLWHGLGSWGGFGPSAMFLFGAVLAAAASVWLWLWRPPRRLTVASAATIVEGVDGG